MNLPRHESSKQTPEAEHSGLAAKLDSLEKQLDALSKLLIQQKRQRRKLTLRLLLGSFVFFAIVFAWFSYEYRESREQAKAIDALVENGAYVQYEPRNSLLVSLLPGDPTRPARYLTKWFGEDFFRAATNVSTRTAGFNSESKTPVLESLAVVTPLRRLRIANMKLSTNELSILKRHAELESLDLARSVLDGERMPWLGKPTLLWLDISHTRIDDDGMIDLGKCQSLQYLSLERTSISDAGLQHLASLKELRYLNLKRAPVTLPAIKKLSDALPNCVIDWEPLVFREPGIADGRASRKGAVRLGKVGPRPRFRKAMPPSDFRNNAWQWQVEDSTYSSGRYQLDVF